MAVSSILRLSACFILLLVFLPGFDGQSYVSTTPYYWSTQYYTITRRPTSYNCGRSMFSDPSGNITSPNYPNNYEDGQFCNYFVVTPSLSTINFAFKSLNLEQENNCQYDWIEFTCQSNSISRTIRFCGYGNRLELSFKPCTRVLIRFVSDGSNVGTGFFVSYDIEPISCQGNCTPVAIGSGYNCTCDANQMDPFVVPPYDQCPDGCHLSDSSPNSYTFCACNNVPTNTTTTSSTTTSTTTYPPPTVPACADGCYPYIDTYGYPVCYCNITVTSTTPTTTTPLECPYGCYIGQDSYGYPICRCEGTTKSTPCPFGCYNVTYYYGYSYCECSTPQPTTPLTITCPSGCFPDRDFWGTPYCRCNSSYSTTTTYPPYNSSSPPCNYPCYYTYNNTGTRYCFCGSSTTVEPCYYPCRYEYDYYGNQRCVCSNNNSTGYSTATPCYSPCYYSYDNYSRPYCSCQMTTTVPPCYYPCRYEYDYYGHQYCSCISTTPSYCNYPCYYGYDSNWNYVCLCNASTVPQSTTPTLPLGCNVTYNSTYGTLMSPNYPNNYPVGINCVQFITIPNANSIQLTFVDFNLYYSSSENCLYDWVEVTGCNGSVKQYCVFYYVNVPIEFICTESYTVAVLFHSTSYNYGYRGFKLNYRSSFASSCNGTGGLVSLGSRGSITSPNYPDSYPLSNDCYYLLQAADGQRIRIRVAFERLRMQLSPECSQEFIKLSCLDGSGSPWLVCGTRIPSPVTFNCSSVEVQFHSEKPPSPGVSPRLFKLLYYGVEGVPSTSKSDAVSLRSRLGLLGPEGAGNVLLILFLALAMETSGWSLSFL